MMNKVSISKSKMKTIFEEAQIDLINTYSQLNDYFNAKKTKGMWIKELIMECGFDELQIPIEKQERIQLLFDNVIFEGIIDDRSSDPDPIPIDDEIIYSSINLDEVNAIFNNLDDSDIKNANKLVDITEIDLYEGTSIEYQDNCCMQYSKGFYEGLVAIAKKSEKDIIAIGRLQLGDGEYHLIFEAANIKFNEFGSNKKYRLVLFSEESNQFFNKTSFKKEDLLKFTDSVSTIDCVINYKPMKETHTALCIDFGTSNTSSGSYGILNDKANDIELTSFVDVTTPEMKEVNLYPTIVYVDDCSDSKHIKYSFGYEAKKKVIEHSYDTEATVFFEIKRWISSLDEEEEICDEEGNTAKVIRKEIIKEYILHVIHLSEQYFKVKFKKLHLSAPVKLKEKFYEELDNMLKDSYKVLPPSNSVDEGIAIIYNSISKIIKETDNNHLSKEDKKESVLILDCGGGTTDLASCEFSSANLKIGNKLEINTKFMNGNSNFGGNNITFRILQLIKIKLAAFFEPEMFKCDLKDLIGFEESEILNMVEANYEESGQYNSDAESEIYLNFTNTYNKSENIIPTKFTDNSNFKYKQDLKKIKRNYYYLWQLAERIKIKFYQEDIVQVNFHTGNDKKLVIDEIDDYYLYICKGKELIKVEKPAEQISITINEIRRILCGDIYGLLNELLNRREFKYTDYKYYKLAGQSCKITLFMELLKEFIPGQRLRIDPISKKYKKSEENDGSIKLKLDCIKGSIAYIRDKECGKIKPEIKTEEPKLIYDVYVSRGEDSENKILSRENPNKIELEIYSQKATKAIILVKNSGDLLERRFVYEFEQDEHTAESINVKELLDDIKERSILSEDSIKAIGDALIAENPSESNETNDEMILFAVPSREGYGMNIYRMIKEVKNAKENYYWWKPRYENFEDESTKSFFDGKR